MDETTRISATEFSKEVGRFSDLALTQAVVITRNGRDRTVMISAEEYGRLKRRDRRVHGAGELPAAMLQAVQRSAADGHAARLDGVPDPRGLPADDLTSDRRLDAATTWAASAFVERIKQTCTPAAVLVYGSRARGTHSKDSDADLAVILQGEPANRYGVLGPMADAAFDVLMETGIHIQPLPIWESELKRPELFGNPALIETIKREGVRL